MAETFNNFFVTIASDIDSKIIHNNTSYKDYLQGSVLNSFFVKPAIEKEVISINNEMKTNKSTGRNSMPTQILKISIIIRNRKIVWKHGSHVAEF